MSAALSENGLRVTQILFEDPTCSHPSCAGSWRPWVAREGVDAAALVVEWPRPPTADPISLVFRARLLVEAAPDLLAALEVCFAHLSNPYSDGESRKRCIASAEAALAKAKGGAS